MGVCLAELLGHLGHAGLGGLGLRARLLVVCAHGEHGGGLAAALHRPGAQHVAARRDDGAHAGHVQHGRGGLKRAGDDPVQQGSQRRGGPLAGDDVGKPRRALGQLGAGGPAGLIRRIVGRIRRIRCHDQPQRAPGRAGSIQLAQASGQGIDDDRVGEGGQRGGDGVLETGGDVQERRNLAEHAGASQQLGGAVLGGEQLLERVAARLPARAVGSGLAFNAEQLVHAGARGVAAGGGLGVCAGRSPAGFFLGRGPLSNTNGPRRRGGHSLLGDLGPLLSRAVCAPRAVGLGDCGLQTRRGRRGVTRQARNLLAVVGDDAVDAGQLAGRGIIGILGGLARASRGRQGRARGLDLAHQRRVLGTGDAGTLVEHVGILTARGQLGGRAQGDLLCRGHQRAAQALGDRGERLPVGRCLIERRRGRALSVLQA